MTTEPATAAAPSHDHDHHDGHHHDGHHDGGHHDDHGDDHGDDRAPHREVVRLSREYQAADLCYELGCSEEELHKALRTAGPRQEDLRRVLGSGI